jgi:hypothetical protein
MSDHEKDALTLQALGILREQVEARVIHYKAEMQTSPELDAVTAQVVNQIKQLQAAAMRERGVTKDPELIANAHTGTLTQLLTVIFGDKNYTTRVIQPVGKRLAKLFFENELNVKAAGEKDKVISVAEQGVYYLLKRYKNRLRTELEGFEYASESIKSMTLDTLNKLERDMQVAFLSRRSPELNKVMTVFTNVVSQFFQKHLPPRLEQVARITIRNAQTATQSYSVPYKIHPERFNHFRTAWERVFMSQMINFCGDEFLARLDESEGEVSDETLKFFTDPHIFSATCDVINHDLYDRLCMEGFLDLPMDWHAHVGAAPA